MISTRTIQDSVEATTSTRVGGLVRLAFEHHMHIVTRGQMTPEQAEDLARDLTTAADIARTARAANKAGAGGQDGQPAARICACTACRRGVSHE